jgi:hypothetical protein
MLFIYLFTCSDDAGVLHVESPKSRYGNISSHRRHLWDSQSGQYPEPLEIVSRSRSQALWCNRMHALQPHVTTVMTPTKKEQRSHLHTTYMVPLPLHKV